ncbi:hypothetical protein GN958_ATG07725, partial [Phytophthora infestans]
GVSNLIEQKGVTAGNITKDLLESTINALLKRVGIAQPSSSSPHPTMETGDSKTAYFYNGKFHLLPESFEFPLCASVSQIGLD